MRFLYTIGVRLYALIVHIAAFFHPKAKDWAEGRKKIWGLLPSIEEKDVFWFHCASLGEFDQGLPVMNLIRKENPGVFILVTFFSPSGFNHYTKREHPVDFACYIPVDTMTNAKRFINHFQPKAAFFVKYEFWSNHIFTLKKSGSRLYSVSTSLRSSQHFFRWYGGFFRNMLKQFDHFFAQNQSTVDLLNSIGIKNVLLTGDTRFDRVIENKKRLVENEKIIRFIDGSNSVFIAGSTWPKDEELIEDLVNGREFDKYIIAPHNVDKTHIDSLVDRLKIPVIRYSALKEGNEITSNVLIIDAIGQLASAYSYGSVAYVGGGFSGGLHNILEPAVFGLPVVFGPKFSRFPEAQAFIDGGIGFFVSNKEEFSLLIEKLKSNREDISVKSIDFVEQNSGASEKIVRCVLG